jgi:phenylalanyl-tRNA synthetase beta chain
MLISMNWIKDFVTLPENLDIYDAANDFTLRTAEVEEIKVLNQHLAQTTIVEVISTKPHPQADKLKLVTFQTGNETKEVVCGAPNVRVGMKVPYAPIGTELPNGLILTPKEIRGVISHGMLCSADELEIAATQKESGLLELPADAKVGESMATYLKKTNDYLIEVDNKSLTHRPDLWGHFGLAREFATIYGLPLKNPFSKEWAIKIESAINKLPESKVKLNVDPNSSCKVFWGISISNLKVKKSPDWIVNRLQAMGSKPINSLVDISNYVLFEMGKPNHIYDQSKIIGNELTIENLKSAATFQALGDITCELLAGDTIIRDQQNPLILAGIIGGTSAAVSDATTDILVEVANWDAAHIRRTSTRLGVRTDASARFEKTLDSYTTYDALLRLIELILLVHPEAKVTSRPMHYGLSPADYKAPTIETSVARINQRLGANIPAEKIHFIFESLGFGLAKKSDQLNLTVPSFRASKDIGIEEDLFEEVGRLIGYDNIVPQAPSEIIRPVELSSSKQLHRALQDSLVLQSSASEVMTYPLVGKALLKQAAWPNFNEELTLINALSEDADRMRPSLIPAHLLAASENSKHFQQFRLFEWGRAYMYAPNSSNKFSLESEHLIINFFHKNNSVFQELLTAIDTLFQALGLTFQLKPWGKDAHAKTSLLPDSWIGIHPHECLAISVRGKTIGAINTIHPLLHKNFKLRGHQTIAIFDFSELATTFLPKNIKMSPISKTDPVTFDCCVVMPRSSSVQLGLDILAKIKNKSLLTSKVHDIFPAPNAAEQFVTFRSYFLSNEGTLTPEMITELEREIVQNLEKSGYSLRRE